MAQESAPEAIVVKLVDFGFAKKVPQRPQGVWNDITLCRHTYCRLSNDTQIAY